jgi:hypothetical protein
MKNLIIIHPLDPTTSFLSMIYAPLLNKTVITGGITRTELRKLIKSHDRILMMGHGNGGGLMSAGQFPENKYPIIDDSRVVNCRKRKTVSTFGVMLTFSFGFKNWMVFVVGCLFLRSKKVIDMLSITLM